MSRIAKSPIQVPSSVELQVHGADVKVKGVNGEMQRTVHDSVKVSYVDGVVSFSVVADDHWAQAGTERMLVNNMIVGVVQGFEKKLQLIGVGYRAQMKGEVLNLMLGYSHDINFSVPCGITIEVPTQTEIVVKGADKQQVGQVAAIIRGYRPPEPYKGKGVRYADERIRRKEVKKTK